MSPSEEFQRSIFRAKQALHEMEQKQSSATPQNFELWLSYVSGGMANLIADVDSAITADGTLPDAEANRIFREHFSNEQTSLKIKNVTESLSSEIDQVSQIVKAAASDTGAYGRSLGEASQQLSSEEGTVDEASLKSIVQDLVASTQEMEENNKKLEARLQESKKQIATLNKDIEVVRTESLTDQLTGIANRKSFDEQIVHMASEAREDKSDFAMLIGDIDFFKKFNDTFGHQTGDQVLRLVARSLESNLKGRDLAARYGGEEFAVLLPHTDMKAALIVANQIRVNISSKELVKKSTGENLGTITISFGVALYRANEPIEDFIGRADACLYAAKHAGRNQAMCETDPNVELEQTSVGEDQVAVEM